MLFGEHGSDDRSADRRHVDEVAEFGLNHWAPYDLGGAETKVF